MACSPEQIAAKRQMALERLKQNQQTKISTPGKASPAKTLGVSINSGHFYGSGQSSTIPMKQDNLPGKTDNKIKAQPLKDNRIFSQPYANRTKEKVPEVSKSVFLPSVCVLKCSLVSEERFCVTLSNFSNQVTDAFKTISSRNYDPNKRLWSFHMKDYKDFVKMVNGLGDKVSIEELPRFIIKLFANLRENSLDMSFLNSIEPKLANILLDFQKEGVRYAIEKQGRCIIADEMGLGKTYQALAVADFYRDDWPVLICTTATTRDTWAAKIRELLPRVPVHKIVVLNSGQSFVSEASFIIASYAMMEKCVQKLAQKNCGVLIMDESHYLKNHKSKCTNAALVLVKTARRVIMLTGTPALSRPSELFTQLQMCDKSFFTYREYTKRYCDGKESQFGWNANGQSNLVELNLLLTRKFMIRRTKEDVMSEMSDKSREVIVLDRELVASKDSFSDLASNYSQTTGKKREEILLTFYAETAIAKIKAVCSYVKKLLKEQKKFVVFAYHKAMMDGLSECLQALNVDFIRIDGSTRTDVRNSMVEIFQTKPNYRVAVLSLKACNAGITLTAAQLVIFAELYWNPSTLAQGESRSHRIGQDENVVVRYLLAKGTADDIIWNIIQKKQTILNDAGLGNEDFSDVASCTEITSTPKISNYFSKTPQKPSTSSTTNIQVNSSNVPPPESCDDYKKLLEDDDDDLFAELNF